MKGARLQTFGFVMHCLFAWGLLVSVEKRAQRQLKAGSTRPDAGVSFVSPKTKLALPLLPAAPRKQAFFTVSPHDVGTNHPTAPLLFFTVVPEGQGAPFGCALTSELLSKR